MRKNVSMAPCPGMSKNVNTEEENKILTGHATGMSCKHSVSSDAAIILNNNVMQEQICTAHTYPVRVLMQLRDSLLLIKQIKSTYSHSGALNSSTS